MLESLAKFAFGLFLILVGFGYIFRYDIVERVRVFIRDFLLDDSAIALERRKWGLFFVIMGTVFLYMGLQGLQALHHR
jgi:hypothetical protein